MLYESARTEGREIPRPVRGPCEVRGHLVDQRATADAKQPTDEGTHQSWRRRRRLMFPLTPGDGTPLRMRDGRKGTPGFDGHGAYSAAFDQPFRRHPITVPKDPIRTGAGPRNPRLGPGICPCAPLCGSLAAPAVRQIPEWLKIAVGVEEQSGGPEGLGPCAPASQVGHVLWPVPSWSPQT